MSELAPPSGPLRSAVSIDVERRIAALTDLTDEYLRWTAYAHAAQAAAVGAAQQTAEAVRRSQRSAVFASNLSERNGSDLGSMVHSADHARHEVNAARVRVSERLESLERSLDMAERALQSWSIALARSTDNLERSTQRLHAAHITQRRLAAVVSTKADADAIERQRAERDLSHAHDDIAQFTAEAEAASELIDRYRRAVASCQAATRLAQRAVDHQRASRQLITLAEDHLSSAAHTTHEAAATLRRQQEAAGRMTQHAILAVRAEEQAGRLLGTADAEYDEAVMHTTETRRHLLDYVEQLRVRGHRA